MIFLIHFIIRSIKLNLKFNFRAFHYINFYYQIMDNKIRKTIKTSPTVLNHTSFRAKFVPVKENFDELNWKYEAYKKGSPNIYEDNLEKLKITAQSNDLKVLELPSVEYLINELKSVQKEVSANKRDYSIFPSMRQKYATKFRDIISDKQ